MSETITPTQGDFNRYVFDNPADHVSWEKFKEVLYKAAAVGLMIIVGAAIVGGVVTLMHFAPIAAPFFLLIAGAAYKVFYSKAFTPLKQKGDQAGESAKMYEGMAEEIQKVQASFKDYNFASKVLNDIGIKSYLIPDQDLSKASVDEDPNPLKATAQLVGRVKYWEKIELETMEEMVKIQDQIKQIDQKSTPDPKDKAEKTCLKMQLQRLNELKLLPAKVAGAYSLHILSDVTDKRDFDVFGTCSPISYLSHLEYRADKMPQPYFYFPDGEKKPPLCTREMFQISQLELSKRIFGDSNLFAR